MVRRRIRQAVLVEAGKELEMMEADETSRRGKGETDCSS